MTVNCPKCGEKLAEVQSVARLNLILHCPFDGHDFGVAIAPPVAAATDATATATGSQTAE